MKPPLFRLTETLIIKDVTMMKYNHRPLAFLLAALMLLSVCSAAPFSVSAASETPQVLLDLMTKFPHKAYWNHVGSSKNNPDGVTDTPCPTHVGCSWKEGACTCNSFCQAIQCMGFAYKAGYDIVGSNPRNWERRETLDADKLRVGDIIRYRGDRHSLCVTGVSGNRISFVDANWYPMCQIRWDSMDLDDMPSFTYVLHDPKNKLKNTNLDFYLPMTQDSTGYLQTHVENKETWFTTDVMNLRKKTSTESAIVSQLPEGISFVVSEKKVNNGYLWGKVTYGSIEGWVALDHCTYTRGSAFAPQFKWFCDVRPVNTSFTLYWSTVQGADYYKIFIYDEDDNVVAKAKTNEPQSPFTLNRTGAYYVKVQSFSKHAESWILTSETMDFKVQKPEEIRLTALESTESSFSLLPGETAAMTLFVRPYCAFKGTISFTSSDKKVAEVDSLGNLLAVSVGIATVTAKDSRTGLSAKCTVNVMPKTAAKIAQVADKLAPDSITLTWSRVAHATGYYVYRRGSTGSFQYIARVTTTRYTDKSVSDASVYTYLVKAFAETDNGTVTGMGSHAVAMITRPAQVQDLKVKAEKGKLTLSWKANKNADSFVIYRASKKDGSFQKIAETDTARLSLYVKSGTTAFFKVRAVKVFNDKRYASAYCAAVKGVAG